MLSGQPSRTLLRSAIRRATHQLLDAPLIFDDPIALELVPEARDPAQVSALGNHGGADPLLMRSLFALRSRFAEDRLAAAAARGVKQYVIIGCGLDTFPWRQPDFARDMEIFALDHPDSLAWSQRRYRERGFARPQNLTYVPADLEENRTAEQLLACGFDPRPATFFSALGVIQYLTRPAVDHLLDLASSSPPASELVLSFAPPSDDLAGEDLAVAAASMASTASLGEPWKTRLRADTLTKDLAARGFKEIFHLTPALAAERYFGQRQDGLRAPRWEQLIAAVR